MKNVLLQLSLGLAGVISLVSFLGRLGAVYWVFDVFTHYYLQFTLLLLLCLLAVPFVRSRRPYLLLLPALLLNLALVVPFFVPARAETPDSTVKVASFNILMTNTAYAEVAAGIRAEAADVVFLSEVRFEMLEYLKASLADLYPHVYGQASGGTLGRVFLSRTPFVSTETVQLLDSRRRRVLKVALEYGGQNLTFFGVHPLPPLSPRWASSRDAELQQAAELAQNAPRPVVVLGDFNASPWSRTMRGFRRAGMTNAARGFGVLPTWRYKTGVLAALSAAPIDHVLVSESWHVYVTDFWLGERFGSDHNMVVAVLGLEAVQD